MDKNTTMPTNFYKPSELLGIFKNFLSNKEINATVLCLHGVYFKSDYVYGNVAYDQLKDGNTSESITIVVPVSLRNDLKNGNLITVHGTLDRKVQNTGSIQLLLNVSRIDKVKEIAISEDEIKRAESRRKKSELGYKNVDGILENKLFTNQRPRVSLIYADTSITNSDFEKGLMAAKNNVDFIEHRINFANANALCGLLKLIDTQDFDVIAIVRGGGSGIEKLDDVAVVDALTNLKTAWIYGVGHEKENLFIRNIADKVIPIPFALGTYFRDMVESVIQKRNNSRAVLLQEVKKQYEKQIEDSNKKNQELTKQLTVLQRQNKEQAETSQKQISALTKATEEARKQTKEQIEAGAKVNKELQVRLDQQGKTLISMQDQQKKVQEEFCKNLSGLQETNGKLQESINKLNAQNVQSAKDLGDAKAYSAELERQLKEAKNGCAMPGCLGVVAIVIGIATIIGFMV